MLRTSEPKMEEALRKEQPARGQGRLADKILVTVRPPSVLASHGQVTEQPYAIIPLELWPKRITRAQTKRQLEACLTGGGELWG